MSVCLDTSFDFSGHRLLVGILIFRRSEYIRRIHKYLCGVLGLDYIHARELSKKKKIKLLSVLNDVLRNADRFMAVRIIELIMPKGVNRFKKYAFLERILSTIIRAHGEAIRRVIVPSDLNIGRYSFLAALEKRLDDTHIQLLQEDRSPCVQLADAILFMYRRNHKLPFEFSYTTHNC